MILDAQNLFGQDQAVTATANATTDLDLGPIAAGNSGLDLGRVDKLYLAVTCAQDAAAAGAATLTVSLQTDDNSSFSSPKTLYTSATFALADLKAGNRLLGIHLPEGVEKYLRVVYTVATGPLTAGKFSAFLTNALQDNTSVVSGVSFPAGA